MQVGVVYLLGDGTFFKIGKSIQPQQRYKRLSIQLPKPVDLVHEIRTNDVGRLERHWHIFFAERRCNGEWFKLAAEDVECFTAQRLVWFRLKGEKDDSLPLLES
jgi:hypothetical protein